MKNILLISNKLFHYRVPIYNYFFEAYRKEGYNFIVLTSEVQKDFDHRPDFKCIVNKPDFGEYKAIVKKYDPAAVIFFMHLKDWIMWPMMHWLKVKKIPTIYWNHGVNLQDPESTYKNTLYRYLHNISDAIILYSPREKHYIKPKNHKKISIGYNTLNFKSFPEITKTKDELKAELDIPYEKVILFAARINPARKLSLLLHAYLDFQDPNIGVLLAGGGDVTAEEQEIIDQNPNIVSLGKIPDQVKFNKLVKLSDVFTIPGKSGLAINQAFYWSVPFVTTNVRQSPEIWYLKDRYNGFIADIHTKNDYRDKLHKIISDDKLRAKMAANAAQTAREEADIERMFSGFLEAVHTVGK